jgi:hypothetical protein
MVSGPDMAPEQLSKLAQIQDKTPLLADSKKAGIQEEKALQEKIKSDRLRAELAGFQQDIDERKKYADKSFCLVKNWIYGVFILLLLQGFLSEPTPFSTKWVSFVFLFKLPDNVLLAVLGGTTVSVVGKYVFVAKYLFPRR